jgi:hypothetical protein
MVIRTELLTGSLLLALATATAAGPGLAQVERGPEFRHVLPMHQTVSERITPSTLALLEAVMANGKATRLDGVEVFAANDKFLPGKVAIAFAHAIESMDPADPRRDRYLAGFRTLSAVMIDDTNDTWGQYYYISALYRFEKLGVLDKAVSSETLATLRTKIDWRSFVDPQSLELIDLPNNYYGVAFSIARLRFLLGWEGERDSERLLARMIGHYREYSGEYGFADETDGLGRYDRYSILLIGEIAQRFIETGIAPPPEVKVWLRQSVDVLLPRLNLRGEGFEYGRSIGAYGETAFLEVLSAAAALDLLTPEEEAMAYAFSSRVAARYVGFWQDPATGSVNLWDHGRLTDAYRGKHRILGENLSLGHQFTYTSQIWSERGWDDRPLTEGYEAWLGTLPKSTTTWFSKGAYDRLLVTYRDGNRVIGLPIINGGPGQHMNTPYFPIPFSPGVLAGSPDQSYSQLLPRITLTDGTVLSPTSFFANVDVQTEPHRTVVTWIQDASRLGGNDAIADARVTFQTRYVIQDGQISRSDEIAAHQGAIIASVSLDFASFSSNPAQVGSDIAYAVGEVTAFAPIGLQCEIASPGQMHQTPTGPFRSFVQCRNDHLASTKLAVGWTVKFR